MGIRMTTPMNEVNAYLQSEFERVQMLTIRALSYLGEQCIRVARDRAPQDSWFDQTGNLRSSIGYVIACNGKIIQYSDFKQVKQGSEGVAVGRNLATEIVQRYLSNKYVLVVVAGMNYAEFVEARDNKDVLATPELFAREQLPKMMQKLKNQIAV